MHKFNDLLLMGAIKLQAAAGYGGLGDGIDKDTAGRIRQIQIIFNSAIGIFIAIMSSCMIAIGAYCGFKYAAARKADKVEGAKQQMVRLIVGIILSVVLGIVGGIVLDLAKKNMIANIRQG